MLTIFRYIMELSGENDSSPPRYSRIVTTTYPVSAETNSRRSARIKSSLKFKRYIFYSIVNAVSVLLVLALLENRLDRKDSHYFYCERVQKR